MRTITKKIKDLTDEEYQYCYKANLHGIGKYGRMRPELYWLRHNKDIAEEEKAHAVLLWDDDKEGYRKLLGWALVGMEAGERMAFFWVKPHLRNKGYGTMLMKEVKKIENKPRVFPWSLESGGFFSKFDVKAQDYAKVLVNKPKVC